MAYERISFDLEGTLVDTAAEIADAANRAVDDHGIGRRPVWEITRLIGAGTRELMLRLLEKCVAEQPGLEPALKRDQRDTINQHANPALSGSPIQNS